MHLVLTAADLAALPPESREAILSLLMKEGGASTAETPTERPAAIDPNGAFGWEQRVDFTLPQITTWMGTASDNTKLGLRIIAEHGPIIDARLLHDAGLGDLRHFQSRTTIRTRTITGNPHAFMLAWDDWNDHERDAENLRFGRYAVTPVTFQSLRQYFGMN